MTNPTPLVSKLHLPCSIQRNEGLLYDEEVQHMTSSGAII
jgi:hypothetical protein